MIRRLGNLRKMFASTKSEVQVDVVCIRADNSVTAQPWLARNDVSTSPHKFRVRHITLSTTHLLFSIRDHETSIQRIDERDIDFHNTTAAEADVINSNNLTASAPSFGYPSYNRPVEDYIRLQLVVLSAYRAAWM